VLCNFAHFESYEQGQYRLEECDFLLDNDAQLRAIDLCLSQGCKAKINLMIWGCITFNGVGTLKTVNGNINAAKYIEILEDNLWPVIVHHYPEENHILQDDIAPVHRTQSVQNYKAQNNINGMFFTVFKVPTPLNVIQPQIIKLILALQP
jgi:hypothetical protein